MPEPTQDTIYIDIDDEITGIIDKLKSSKRSTVSMVLPKRATVLQSIVNMRLLKRASTETNKKVILITTEAGLLPLAGAAKVYVAKTIGAKAEIPTAPSDDVEETVDEDEAKIRPDTEITAANAGAIAVGALAGLPPKKDEVETLEMEDEDTGVDEGTFIDLSSTSKEVNVDDVVKKDRKLKIPNFNKFRIFVFGSAFLFVALIIGFIYAFNVMPRAIINVKTDASSINSSLNLTIATSTTKLDIEAGNVPAQIGTIKKTYTQQATTTGTLNLGAKATGTVTVSVICTAPLSSISTNTGLTSNKLSFVTTDVLVFGNPVTSGSNFVCSGNVPIRGLAGGTQYNLAANSNFTVVGYSGMTGVNSSALANGTDDPKQVVTQTDIDTAKAKITNEDTTIKTALSTQLTQAGSYAISGTYNVGTPVVTTNVKIGEQAASVTVTEVVTYTMLGVLQKDLKALVANSINPQIDVKKQTILDEGLSTATFNIQSANESTAVVTFQSSTIVGPNLDAKTIKKQILGMKSGDVRSLLQSNPDVTSIEIKYSPFWVTSVPKNASKVTVNIAKPTKASITPTTVKSTDGTNP